MSVETRMIKDPDHPLNKTPFDHTYPEPLCDLRPFQMALRQMFGTEGRTGRPWIRVIWAQDQRNDEYGPISKNWDHYGDGGRGEWRARYLYSSERYFEPEVDHETGIISHRECWIDLSPPRFALESFIPPEMACMGWADPGFGGHRTIFGTYYDNAGDRFTPHKPTAGLYQPLHLTELPHINGGIIADHDGYCCAAAEVSDRTCFGYYTEPSAVHLQILAKFADQLANQQRERRPGLLTEEEHNDSRKRAREQYESYWRNLEERLGQIALEACRTHTAMLSEYDKRQRWGAFSFGASKSGASAAQIEQWRKEKAVTCKP